MKITGYTITLAIITALAIFLWNDSSDQTISQISLNERHTPQVKKKKIISNLSKATIKQDKPKPPPPPVEEMEKPTIIRTPEHLETSAIKKKNTEPGDEIRVFLPKNLSAKNGYLVVVPAQWNAPNDPKFNPLLAKYRAPWSASLKRKYPNDVLSNSKLPNGVYDVLIYKNDGNEGRAPTLVASYEVSSGGHVYIQEKHWNQLDASPES